MKVWLATYNLQPVTYDLQPLEQMNFHRTLSHVHVKNDRGDGGEKNLLARIISNDINIIRACFQYFHQFTKRIPIIALTAHAMQGDEQKAKDSGCDDYDVKPVELPRLLEKIEGLLAKKE